MDAQEIRRKREETGGLLTEKAAAKALGAKKISGLKEGEKPAIIARIERVFAIHRFEKNGRRGLLTKVALSDDTGSATMILWNGQARLAEDVEKGDVAEVSGALVKKTSPIELHSTPSTKLTEVQDADWLHSSKTIVSLTEASRLKEADFFAIIKKIGPRRFFEKNGAKGSVATCVVEDGAEAPLVLWDENSEAVEKMREGMVVKVEGGRAKTTNGATEIHVHYDGRVILAPRSVPPRFLQRASIPAQAP